VDGFMGRQGVRFALGFRHMNKPYVKGAMNLIRLVERFQSEAKCRAYLEELRWPDGVRCPRCHSEKISRIAKRNQFDCDSCRYQFSVTAGTIFADSHLPLWKWFAAAYLIGESRKGISANQLKRTLDTTYKTAFYLTHRIRAAMKDENPIPLSGIVEVDETWIGGKNRRGRGWGQENKTMVLGAVERGGSVRFRVEKHNARRDLTKFIRETIDDDAPRIMTDGWKGYATADIADHNTTHETVNHMAGEWVRADVHTNTVEGVWSLLKRSIVGSYHQLSVKHLPAYLDEMAFRFNNRENPYLFRDTVLKLLGAKALPYKSLTA
jgi:transposase-like protein